MAGTTLRLERTFDASPERLWKAWTDPDEYARWLNPAPGHDLVIREWDLRVGGRVRFDMPQPDGNPNPQEGVFHELVPNRRLVSGDADKTFLLEVTFEPRGKKTHLVVQVTGVPPEWHAAATEGWGRSFDKLAGVVTGEADREIVVARLIEAPRERVFAAFTDARTLDRWWGPDGFRTTTHAFDLYPGGYWRYTMHGPDGRDYKNWIRYEEIRAPERIAYAHGGEREDPDFHATATFEAQGEKTLVTLRSTFPTREARAYVVREYHAIEGGRQTLGRLAAHLAGKPAVRGAG
ncbi:MAG: SRPBCC domain-containing protein [Methanobacteriota archaeon]